jgi:hypothetical protein
VIGFFLFSYHGTRTMETKVETPVKTYQISPAQLKAMDEMYAIAKREAYPRYAKHIRSVLLSAYRTSGNKVNLEAQVDLFRKSDPHWFKK